MGKDGRCITALDPIGVVTAVEVLEGMIDGVQRLARRLDRLGQALPCANLILGLPETTGLSTVGMYP